MRALQLHYTSCRQGQSGGAGFQTRSMSPGIALDEQREIERRGIYRPPRDAPREPSAEEMARSFPPALRWYRLGSGRWALTRSSYTGRDYSGRWGNFFAHTLVFDAELPADLWPIDLYEWPEWRDQLPVDDDDGPGPPAPLPVVDIHGLDPAESFQLDELREFLAEKPGRTELLATMGRAVLAGADASRAVVIRDTATASLYWIACLQKLFPPAQARTLTYSTYQDDPRGAAAVNATTGDTAFTFDEDERRFRFFMFDVPAGVHSEVPKAADDYPAVAARWLAEEPERLAAFGEFMLLFEPGPPDRELIAAVDLFDLACGCPARLPGERLAAALEYALRHGTASGRPRLVETVGSVAVQAGAASELPPADARRLIEFLIVAAADSRQPAHRALACGAWLTLLRGSVVQRGVGLAEAEAAWDRLLRTLPESAAEIGPQLLAGDTWSAIEDGSRQVSCAIGTFLLQVTCDSLRAAGRSPEWEQPEVAGLAASLLGRGGDLTAHSRMVLAAVPREPAALAAVVLRLAMRWRPGTEATMVSEDAGAVGRVLASRLAAGAAEDAAEVRRRLAEAAAWDVLVGEWQELCEQAADPLAAFEEYRRMALETIPALAQRCAGRVASSLLARMPAVRRPRLALGWLLDGFAGSLPEELLAKLVQDANQAVPVDADSRGDTAAEAVAAAAERLGLALRPDRPRLRRALAAARLPGTSLPALRLAEVGAAAGELSAPEYESFLAGFIPAALEHGASPADHGTILRAVYRDDLAGLCTETYKLFFRPRRKAGIPACLEAALGFWLSFDATTAGDHAVLLPLGATAREGLVQILARLARADLERLELRLGCRAGKEGRQWADLAAAVARRRQGRWSRLVATLIRRQKPAAAGRR